MQNVRRHRWKFTASVMLPVVVVLATTALGALGFLLWATSSIDARSLERELHTVTNIIDEKISRLNRDQESIAVWDDAIENTKLGFDNEWVDYNLGTWLYSFFGHDQVVVLDALDQPIYAMSAGEQAETESYESFKSAVTPLIEELRARIEAGALDVEGLDDWDAPSVSDLMMIQGHPAIVGVVPIISDTGRLVQPRGSEYLHIAIDYLDASFAEPFRSRYLLDDAAFSADPALSSDHANYIVTNNAGRFVAVFSWLPERPGRALWRQMMPVLIVSFIIAILIVSLLLRRLWLLTTDLESGRVNAERQARTDNLTGLANRAAFDDYLQHAVSERRGRDLRVNLMMLDLDRFKQINDTLGHQAGDDLIRTVGQRLKTLLGPDEKLSRLGGDEFAIVDVSTTTSADMLVLAERIIAELEEPIAVGQSKAHIGVSIGIVSELQGSTEAKELVRKADIALYEAKAAGRNRAVVYQEQMNELLQLQRTIEGELREALQLGDQLTVMFQPLVDQKSRTITGAEALMRWQHPKYGAIPPSRFIPVAENSGMIEALGELVLRQACELGARARGRTVAVNISPTQLRNIDFPMKVLAILAETGMRPHDLELEITENILLEDKQASQHSLRALRAAGIHIALDDFGTGYSSLSYLKRYPVDRIKIDRSFVKQLAEGHVSVAIVQAIVTLAHAMQIAVTAEGVETDEQADILGRLGCNTLQGYLFSPAVPTSEILARFAAAPTPASRRRA